VWFPDKKLMSACRPKRHHEFHELTNMTNKAIRICGIRFIRGIRVPDSRLFESHALAKHHLD